MASSIKVSEPIYVLRLSESEAKLIKNLTQNTFYENPVNEPISESKDRESIFNALKNVGVK